MSVEPFPPTPVSQWGQFDWFCYWAIRILSVLAGILGCIFSAMMLYLFIRFIAIFW